MAADNLMQNNLYIVWKDHNDLGISIIDEQHRGIISTINSLYYFIQSGLGEEIIRPTMIMLVEYTNVHFKTEEALMLEAGFPSLKEHLILHKSLLEKTKKLALETPKNKDPERVLSFLKDWWLDHIGTEDKKYAPFLRTIIEN